MAEPLQVTVLGTGIMGTAMARRWADHGFAVTAWNRDRAKAERVGGGVAVADTPSSAVEGADVLVTMLADGDVTERVMTDVVGSVANGAVWIQMGTVGIDATDRLVVMASAAGVGFVDAPVSGTKQPAEQGKLTVLAAGPEALRARADAVFAPVAARVTWVGETPGAGTRLKLVVNAWLAALLAGLAEAIALADGIGVDPHAFLAAIEGGPLGSGYAAAKGPMMIDRNYPAAFPLHLLLKDVDLVSDAAASAGVDLRLPAAIRSLLADVTERHGDDDMSAIVEAFRSR